VKHPRKSKVLEILCAFMLVFMLAFIVSGCGGKEEGRNFVPSDQLPEGVTEYTMLPFSDEVNFTAMFVSEAINQRVVADKYNELVCRLIAEDGDEAKIEELVKKTRDAYERADKMAEMALDVAIALKELEKQPDYVPFKLPKDTEKKTALNEKEF